MATTKAYEIGQLAGQLDVDSTGDITLTGNLDVSYSGFDSDFAAKTTTNLTEGDNLYYTTARADSDATVAAIAAISVTDAGGDGSLTYSNGAITYTGPSAGETRAHFSAGTGISINSGQISVNSSDNVTFADITTTGVLNGPATFYIDPAPVDSAGGLLVIRGDLQVDGTTTTVNSTTVTINDKNIVLADSAANASEADGAGITVNGASATISYDAANDEWDFNKDINVTGNITVSGTVDGVDIALRDSTLTSTTTTANAALPKAGGTMTGALIVNAGNGGLDVRVGTDKRILFAGNIGEIGSVAGFQAVNTTGNANTAFGIRATDIRFATGSDERVRITDTGVGIGTTNPATKLDVRGTVQILNSNAKLQFSDTSRISELYTFNGGRDLRIEASQDVLLNSSGGNVGVGTTGPAYPLDVNGGSDNVVIRVASTSADSLIVFEDNSTTDRVLLGALGEDFLLRTDLGKFIFKVNNNTYDAVTILNNGNVGIGTSSPVAELNVDGRIVVDDGARSNPSGGPSVVIDYQTTSDVQGRIRSRDWDGSTWKNFTVEANDINLIPAGNVGIGITSPAHKLDVDGAIATRQVRHSIRPTLNLDFANSKELDPRITFYRDSIATYYDSKGVLRYANVNEPRFDHDPATGDSKGLLIEESRTNTTPYSQHIISGYGWGVSGTGSFIQPYASVAPDGTYSASRLFFANANHSISINNSGGWSVGDTVTTSMWIKGTSGETMRFASGGIDFGNITLTGEWQRVEGTTTTVNTYTNINTYGGATARDVFVWGAQAEVASFATSYIPSDTTFTSRSTEATYYDETGVLRTAPVNSPRYGYKYDGRKWVKTGLILEVAATNSIQNFFSSAGALQWSNNQNSEPVATSSVTAPDGSTTAFKQEINSTASAIHSIYDYGSVPVGQQLCFSVYAKAAEYDRIYMYTDGVSPTIGGIFYDLSTGTISGGPLQPTDAYGIENVGGGWYRCWFSGTPTSGSTAYFHIDIAQSNNGRIFVGTVGEGVYLWGPQREYSAVPSSYIYTDTGNVTRSADVASSASYTREQDKTYLDHIDKYDWFNQDQGTIYTDITPIDHDPASSTYFVFNLTDKTTENTITLRYGDVISGTDLFMKSFNTVEVDLASFTSAANTQMKAAVVYEEDNVGFSVNGGTAKVDTSYNPTHLTYLALSGTETGYPAASHHIKKLSYYPARLTNAEIQALTENN